jgi:hypothetical protein
LIVSDLIDGADRWIERCHDNDPLSGDKRPYSARLWAHYRHSGRGSGVVRTTHPPPWGVGDP